MYWTDWAQPPKLERAWLDGTHRTVILDDIGRVYGFTIDYALGRLYWADIDKTVIESAALDGKDCKPITCILQVLESILTSLTLRLLQIKIAVKLTS